MVKLYVYHFFIVYFLNIFMTTELIDLLMRVVEKPFSSDRTDLFNDHINNDLINRLIF